MEYKLRLKVPTTVRFQQLVRIPGRVLWSLNHFLLPVAARPICRTLTRCDTAGRCSSICT